MLRQADGFPATNQEVPGEDVPDLCEVRSVPNDFFIGQDAALIESQFQFIDLVELRNEFQVGREKVVVYLIREYL